MSKPDALPRILTTTVGSYPVPEWLAALPSEQALVDATRVVFDTQRQAGIDLPTDGELYRFDVNHPDTNGMIEYFVHIDSSDPPKDLVVVAADIPDSVSRVELTPRELPSNWRRVPAPPSLAAIGDSFAAERKSAILVLPSALVPPESNWLVNPLHPDAAEIQVHPLEPFRYDARFFA